MNNNLKKYKTNKKLYDFPSILYIINYKLNSVYIYLYYLVIFQYYSFIHF